MQLQVLIQSIWDLYEPDVKIAVFYNSVAQEDINEIEEKIPNIILKDLQFDFFLQPSAARKLNLWYELFIDSLEDEKIIFMDSDMMLIRKIDNFFDDSFDIGYTHKTVPEENLKKPLNTGVLLINNTKDKRKKILSYMKYWRDKINKIMDSKNFNGSTRGWGAIDQLVLGETLGTRDIIQMTKIIKKKGLRFKGFPCKKLNNVLNASLNDSTLHIVHFKGSWRDILPNGTWEKTKLRKKDDNGIRLLNLWRSTLEKFNKR